MDFIYSLLATKVAYADFNSFMGNVETSIVNPLINFLFAIAVVYFLYGVLEFILNQQNEEKKTSGKAHMLWGVVGITIMLGVWGILHMLLNTLGVQGIDLEKGNVHLTPYTPPNK